jgi:hypothetical protein
MDSVFGVDSRVADRLSLSPDVHVLTLPRVTSIRPSDTSTRRPPCSCASGRENAHEATRCPTRSSGSPWPEQSCCCTTTFLISLSSNSSDLDSDVLAGTCCRDTTCAKRLADARCSRSTRVAKAAAADSSLRAALDWVERSSRSGEPGGDAGGEVAAEGLGRWGATLGRGAGHCCRAFRIHTFSAA